MWFWVWQGSLKLVRWFPGRQVSCHWIVKIVLHLLIVVKRILNRHMLKLGNTRTTLCSLLSTFTEKKTWFTFQSINMAVLRILTSLECREGGILVLGPRLVDHTKMYIFQIVDLSIDKSLVKWGKECRQTEKKASICEWRIQSEDTLWTVQDHLLGFGWPRCRMNCTSIRCQSSVQPRQRPFQTDCNTKWWS